MAAQAKVSAARLRPQAAPWARFLPKASGGAVGLDVGTTSFKIVELTKQGAQQTLERAVVQDVPSTDRKAAAAAIKRAFEQHAIGSRRVNIAVSGPAVIVRYIEMPAMTDQELVSAIQFEAEKYIPFNPAEVVMDSCVIEKFDGDKRMRVLLVAAKKELIDERVALLQEAGLTPRIIDVDAFALANAFLRVQIPAKADEIRAVLDIGAEVTTATVLRGTRPAFTRDIMAGGNAFTRAMMEKLGVAAAAAEALKRQPGGRGAEIFEAVKPVIDNLVSEIRLSFNYYESQADHGIEALYLSGGVTGLEGVSRYIQENVEVEVRAWDPLQGLQLGASVDRAGLTRTAPRLAVAMGLALRSLS
ncbi:MAG: type IV pilus assembly protein PilM [Candidatus Omnitrophica bacterium]|nr:type IV pilus assembly protein PilM [Candidatus Omnitrophota bacterium]